MKNKQAFWQVFLILLSFGIVFLGTLYFFGSLEYLILGLAAEAIIILNFFVWWLLRAKKILTRPILLTFFYLLKIGIAAAILVVVYKNLPTITEFFK